MRAPYRVRFTAEATEDLVQLNDFLAEHDPAAADDAIATIERALAFLAEFPWACRRSSGMPRPEFRELVIPFGKRGYVALFEIEQRRRVTVLAIRSQREFDYH